MSTQQPPLFSSGCRLTAGCESFASGLEGLAHSYRFTLPRRAGLSRIGRAPVRHRSTGWVIGSVGVSLGEHSPLRIDTAGIGGLVLYAPITGRWQLSGEPEPTTRSSRREWILFNEQPTKLLTGTSSEILLSLQEQRLQATYDTMMGTLAEEVCPRIRKIGLDLPRAERALNDLLVLLQHAGKAVRDWPSWLLHAEDVLYRLAARLLMPAKGMEAQRQRKARTQRAVDVACGFMLSEISRAFTLTELEAAVNVGSRTLRNAFLDQLGMTPRVWLKEQRLLLAHHIIGAQSGQETVSAAAATSGINHLGRFAQDYKQRFGAYPGDRSARP